MSVGPSDASCRTPSGLTPKFSPSARNRRRPCSTKIRLLVAKQTEMLAHWGIAGPSGASRATAHRLALTFRPTFQSRRRPCLI